MSFVAVLRWKGFEMVREREQPFHPGRMEVMLGEQGLDDYFSLWAFEFTKVDDEGRRIYEAAGNPYQGVVEEHEKCRQKQTAAS